MCETDKDFLIEGCSLVRIVNGKSPASKSPTGKSPTKSHNNFKAVFWLNLQKQFYAVLGRILTQTTNYSHVYITSCMSSYTDRGGNIVKQSLNLPLKINCLSKLLWFIFTGKGTSKVKGYLN